MILGKLVEYQYFQISGGQQEEGELDELVLVCRCPHKVDLLVVHLETVLVLPADSQPD